MKKNVLVKVIGAAMLTVAMPVHAQQESNVSSTSVLDHLTFDIEATTGLANKGMTPADFNFHLGYQLAPHFYVFAKAGGSRSFLSTAFGCSKRGFEEWATGNPLSESSWFCADG